MHRRLCFFLFVNLAFAGLTCNLSPTGAASTIIPDPIPKSITVASWNLEWFFDDFKSDNRSDLARKQSAPNKNEWEWKLARVAEVIAKLKPTILCLQEVENRDVVWKLAQKLKDDHRLSYRVAFIEGADSFTEQDVAIIYREGLVQYSRREQSRETWDSNDYYNLQKHLIGEFEWGQGDAKEKLTLINVHLRATADAIGFRKRQCRLIHKWMEEQIRAGENVIVTGDINTEESFGEETADGDMANLRGLVTADKADDLVDLNEHLQQDLRATHIGGRQFDRILVSQPMIENSSRRKDLVFSRIVSRMDLVVRGKGKDSNHFDKYYEIDQNERDISDHYPIMAEFLFQ